MHVRYTRGLACLCVRFSWWRHEVNANNLFPTAVPSAVVAIPASAAAAAAAAAAIAVASATAPVRPSETTRRATAATCTSRAPTGRSSTATGRVPPTSSGTTTPSAANGRPPRGKWRHQSIACFTSTPNNGASLKTANNEQL